MKFRILLFVILHIGLFAVAQQPDKPKLVVGIVVDQMRYEYLDRFQAKFGAGGFKRLMDEGFTLTNAHYNYVPTFTGPGHASIYTGTTPALHGIIANEFYDKMTKVEVNCVEDKRYQPVGSKLASGDVAPSRLLTSTVTDELRISSQQRSKVIGISFKDRGAVLPAGHTPNAAYWFDSKSGNFVTSTYYMDKLPDWLDKFNKRKLPADYLTKDWNTLLPIDQYTESGPDDSPYETKMFGKEKPIFPYKLSEMQLRNGGGFDVVSYTPYGNDLLTQLATEAVMSEKLGIGSNTDFMAISYSCTDIIGHAMGPNSVEIEDTYLRLDRNLADLLSFLDKQVGAGNYSVFLTADHGVAEVPQSLRDKHISAGYFNTANLEVGLRDYLKPYFPGKNIIENVSNYQIFLNQEVFNGNPRSSGIDILIATELIANYVMAQDGIAAVYPESVLRQANYSESGTRGMVIRGFNTKRSGDVVYVLQPGWIEGTKVVGTTHGSPYTYDTHVPVLFFGYGFKHGASQTPHVITDIAPTISNVMKIRLPSGCTGQVVQEALK